MGAGSKDIELLNLCQEISLKRVSQITLFSPDFLRSLIDSLGSSSMKKYLESFYFDCRVRNLTSKTMQGYGERLQNFHRFLESKGISFDKVDKRVIQSYILSMKDKVSDHTVNGRIRVLRLFFNYIRREGLWDNGNPMEDIRLVRAEKRVPGIIGIDEMGKLLSVPNRRTFPGYRNYCMLLLFWDTMIRLGELLSLRVSDVDLKAGMIKVYGKGRKERCIPLGTRSIKALHHFLVKFRSEVPGDYLICRKDGVPLGPRAVQHILRRIGKRAGVKVNPHLLRHSAGTFWIKSGGSSAILQKILGHTTQSTTQLYIHLAGSDVKEWHSRFSPGDRLKAV
jgi:integrase/recombinase XerD